MVTPDSAIDYLAGLGLVADTGASADLLSGGVSCTVIAVDDGKRKLIVKEALSKLAVEDDWFAPVERLAEESAAMVLAADVIPGHVPAVVNFDSDRNIVVLEHAPAGWEDLRTRLLRGDVDPADGARLGAILAEWHSGTTGASELAQFADRTAFEALRVDPFYRVSAEREPAVATMIETLIEQMAGRCLCLVHGDFSPKNILAGEPGEIWVIDFEVTHAGDPAFDIAFMLHHLIAKSIHLPRRSAQFDEYALGFLDAYESGISPALASPARYVVAHIGAQLLARVIGKSPAPYLSEAERALARALAESILLDPPASLRELLNRREVISV